MHAAQADHAEEVLDMVLPAGHQPAKVMEPSEKSLDSPTSAVAAKRATILRRCSPLSTMRCDHFDAITLGQISIQAVTVICFVANQSCWKAVEEAVPEDAFDKLAVKMGWASPNSPPFEIKDYQRAAAELGQTARDLTELTRESRATVTTWIWLSALATAAVILFAAATVVTAELVYRRLARPSNL